MTFDPEDGSEQIYSSHGRPRVPLGGVLGKQGWDDPIDHEPPSESTLGDSEESETARPVEDAPVPVSTAGSAATGSEEVPEVPVPVPPQVLAPPIPPRVDEGTHEGPWLSRAAAAVHLDVPLVDLDIYVEELPHYLLGNEVRYRQADLDGLLKLAPEAEEARPVLVADGRWGRVMPAIVEIQRYRAPVRTLAGEQDVDALVLEFSVDLEAAGSMELTYTVADNHERWVHCTRVQSDAPGLGRLRHGGRLGVREVEGGLGAELALLRYTDFPWSGLTKATVEEINAAAQMDVRALLTERGATTIGTRAETEACTSGRKNFLSVHFPATSAVVPVWAYVLTRVLPLLHTEPVTEASNNSPEA